MYIGSSNVGMSSSHKYASTQKGSTILSVWGGTASKAKPILAENNEKKQKVYGDDGQNPSFSNQLYERFQPKQLNRTMNVRPIERLRQLSKMREQTMRYLLEIILGKQSGQTPSDLAENSGSLGQQFGGQLYQEFYFNEQEEMSFSTQGTVCTSDGREIHFNVDLSMSRSFTEYSSQYIDFGAPRLLDPLVINLDVPAADVTDQKFYFDLDCDGHEEQISQLSAGSGYLALDKNGDGKIGDGSELFGTGSGNGFADLSAYDEDGNGWIDEADSIFEKLLIWRKDASGKDELIGLGKAGVGAIYLGAADTQFSLNNSHNETNAIIRKTGMFLFENGGVGTLQQLDLAT